MRHFFLRKIKERLGERGRTTFSEFARKAYGLAQWEVAQ